jgi:hypothetical protein
VYCQLEILSSRKMTVVMTVQRRSEMPATLVVVLPKKMLFS